MPSFETLTKNTSMGKSESRFLTIFLYILTINSHTSSHTVCNVSHDILRMVLFFAKWSMEHYLVSVGSPNHDHLSLMWISPLRRYVHHQGFLKTINSTFKNTNGIRIGYLLRISIISFVFENNTTPKIHWNGAAVSVYDAKTVSASHS